MPRLSTIFSTGEVVTMNQLMDTLRLLTVFVAYGITGHMDHEDEVLLEQSHSVVGLQRCHPASQTNAVRPTLLPGLGETDEMTTAEPSAGLAASLAENPSWIPRCLPKEPWN